MRPNVGGAAVPFKSVFTQSANFTFTVDNPAFSVKPSETIGPKKTYSINVFYRPTATSGIATATGPVDVDESTSAMNNSLHGKKVRGHIEAGLASMGESLVSSPTSSSTNVHQAASRSRFAKLVVSHPSGVCWTYYLKGTQS